MKPRGFLPNLAALLGLLIPGCSFILFLPSISKLFRYEASFLENSGVLVFSMIILGFPIFWGLFFSGLFPFIKITQQGIAYCYLEFFGGVVRWNEIEAVSVRKDFLLIRISRSGLPIFNGLYFNKFYGRLFKIGDPILLVWLEKKDNDAILQRIINEVPWISIGSANASHTSPSYGGIRSHTFHKCEASDLSIFTPQQVAGGYLAVLCSITRLISCMTCVMCMTYVMIRASFFVII